MLKRGAVKPRVYPATHNGRLDGRPVFFSKELWEKKRRTQSASSIAAQLLQNPMADSAATFNVLWLRPYYLRPRTLNVYIMCDPSRGRSATSDNTAISVVGIASNGAKFLLDGVCHRMPLSDRWLHLRRLYHKWTNALGVQRIAVGYERYGAQSDDEYFKEKMLAEQRQGIRNAIFSIKELAWPRDGTQSKQERVERLEPDFRNSRFYIPAPVIYEGKPRVWKLDSDPDSPTHGELLYLPVHGRARQQIATVADGNEQLLATAIRAIDEDRRVYDVTVRFIDEYLTFPFGQFKDLIDATSRIYDMEATVPIDHARRSPEPVQYWDR